MENFEFEGAFFALDFKKVKLKKRAIKHYKIEGGFQGSVITPVDEIIAEFMSSVFALEIVDPATIARSTERSNSVNMARRSYFFLKTNPFSEMFQATMDRMETFMLDS